MMFLLVMRPRSMPTLGAGLENPEGCLREAPPLLAEAGRGQCVLRGVGLVGVGAVHDV
jgi:hypothetical protein